MKPVSLIAPNFRRLASAALLLALALAGCTQFGGEPLPDPSARPAGAAPGPVVAGGPALARGMAQYEEGNYGEAASQFRQALEQKLSPPEQVRARKHLAFAYCVAGKDRQCGDEFKKLLELSPGFELDPAEAGHPIWGPVFRRVKAKKPEPRK